jgi:glucose/arabinose dehydrogenase
MTSVKDGGFYGWPYSYYGSNVDTRVEPPRPDLVAKAVKPDYALGPHTASLGLASSRGAKLATGFENGMFVGPARLVEPQAAVGLQGHLRAVRERPAERTVARRADRLPVERRRRVGSPGRCRDRRDAAGCSSRTTSATRSGASHHARQVVGRASA